MDPSYDELLRRVERLEHIVEDLRSHGASPPASPAPRVAPAPDPSSQRPAARAPARLDLRSSLRSIGIALLLFGVIFLFKFSGDEPTAIRTMRVAIGVALGTGLVLVGRFLLVRDRAFAQVLTGGGIGVWYISGFAAYQLFALIGVSSAFAYMTVVTVLAFFIAVRQSSQSLAIVATIGGLATPSLLHDADRSVAGPVLYVVIVVTGAVAIHVRRNWAGLLWVTAAASTVAMVATQFLSSLIDFSATQREYLQAGTVYLWAMFATFAATSYIRATPGRQRAEDGDDRLLLALAVPIYLVAVTVSLWHLGNRDTGRLCIATAIVYTIATARFFAVPAWGRLTSVHLAIASAAATTGALLLIDGDRQNLAVATEALALRFLFRRTRLPMVSGLSHALFVIAAFLVLRDLESPRPPFPLADVAGFLLLWPIVAVAAAALLMPRSQVRRFYFYSAHAGIMTWIYHQCSLMHNGQAIVTMIWGLYGVGLMIAGLRRSNRAMRTVGLLTLLAVVAKLFVIDLRSLPAIWRVLLFIGFGGVFLALSYWFLSLDRSRMKMKKEEVAGPDESRSAQAEQEARAHRARRGT